MSSQPVSFCVTFSVTSGVFAARKALAKLLEGLSPMQQTLRMPIVFRWYWLSC